MYENAKIRPAGTFLRMQEEGIKETDGGGEFNYYILYELL
jgi:hypothetical protein